MTLVTPVHRDLETKDAAALLKVPPRLIHQWRRAGKAMPAGLLRAPVPGGVAFLWHVAELEPLAAMYHASRSRRLAPKAPDTPS